MPEMKTWTANGVAYEIVDAKAREDAAKAYSPDNKPTAADVGAVSISGSTMSGNINMNNHRITGLPLPESGTEPATKEFVENFSVEGHTYVATDDNKDGNIVLRPYVADVDELVVGGHINNKENPHGVTAEQVGAAPIDSVWTATDPKNDGNIVLKRGAVINGGSGGGSSGGLTAEEVQAMIDAALGGIENGTY